MVASTCPPPAALDRLFRGTAAPEAAAQLVAHLDRCDRCAAAARALAEATGVLDTVRGDASPLHADLLNRLLRPPANANSEETSGTDLPPLNLEDSVLDNGPALRHLGTYRVIRELGRGGMGVVYEAEDPALQRKVALKVIRPGLDAGDVAKRRFLAEARAAAKVKSDHVVTIYQVGEDRGVAFAAMEFLHGEPMDAWLKRGKPPAVAQVLRVARETALGLAAAHEHGVIHRDIKPSNLWLEAPNGRVKLLDFGLARPTAGSANLTQSGAIVGTPAYMSPEQARGMKVDPRADLFSLGCVLYQLCTGQLPFQGPDTMSVLMALAITTPPPPIELRPDLPPALSDLVVRLLAKEPAGRPESAHAVVAEVTRIVRELAGQTAVAPPLPAGPNPFAELTAPTPPPVKPRPKARSEVRPAVKAPPRRRSPVGVALAVAGLAVVLVAAAMGVVLMQETKDGVIRVEIDDPAIEATLGGKGFTFRAAGKDEITVAPGARKLKVKRGDLEFETDQFVLKKGDKVTLKVEYRLGKVQVVQGDKVIGVGGPKPPPAKAPDSATGPEIPGTGNALRFDAEEASRPPVTSAVVAGWDSVVSTYEVWVTTRNDDFTASILGGPNGHLSRVQQLFRFYSYHGEVDTPALPAKNERVHLAGVNDGKQRRVYVNGKRVGVVNAAGEVDPKSPAAPITLGSPKFTGIIDLARVSKVARYDKDFTPPTTFKPDADTVALYLFEEGKGNVLKDSSGNKRDAKIVAGTWVTVDKGPPPPGGNYELELDGKSTYVDVPSLSRDDGGPITLEAYVTVAGTGGANLLRLEGSFPLQVHGWPSPTVAGDWVPNIQVGGTKFQGADTPPLKVGQRAHVAAVIDKDTFTLYLDGKKANSTAYTAGGGSQRGSVFGASLDRGRGTPGHLFSGTLDEIRISKGRRYDKDFTPQARFAPDRDTIALYHCDEGRGDALRDASGNDHHGTIVGEAKWVKGR